MGDEQGHKFPINSIRKCLITTELVCVGHPSTDTFPQQFTERLNRVVQLHSNQLPQHRVGGGGGAKASNGKGGYLRICKNELIESSVCTKSEASQRVTA